MADKSKISEEDRMLFRQSVGQTKKMRHDKVVRTPRRTAPMPRQQIPADEHPPPLDRLSDTYEPMAADSDDVLSFSRPGLQHKVLRKLRRGPSGSTAELDLHGMTVAVARQALLAFIQDCRRQRLRCVKIIHGKGLSSPHRKPVLKNRTNSWLRQCSEVLAFCPARPEDGGNGAVYVLIKQG